MEDKKVFVTGGSGGLGTAVVEQLLAADWQVYALVRTATSAEKMRSRFPGKKGKRLILTVGDVLSGKDIEAALKEIKKPDALVHLAGGFKGGAAIAECNDQDYNFLFDLNVQAAFLLLRTFLPVMKTTGKGAIVTIGAKPALYPGGENAIYAASKAALINLTLSAAEEGRKSGVRANVIVPAVIRTKANEQWASSPEVVKKWTSPEAIAQTIAWLISEEGRSVTGTVLPMFNRLKTF